MIANDKELPGTLVRRGVHLGQKLCERFPNKMIDDEVIWVDIASATPNIGLRYGISIGVWLINGSIRRGANGVDDLITEHHPVGDRLGP